MPTIYEQARQMTHDNCPMREIAAIAMQHTTMTEAEQRSLVIEQRGRDYHTELREFVKLYVPNALPADPGVLALSQRIAQVMGIPNHIATASHETSYSASRQAIEHYAERDRRDAQDVQNAGVAIPCPDSTGPS